MPRAIAGRPAGRDSSTAVSDTELVERARRGLPEALGEMYERHATALLRLATRITGSVFDAEDVLHDLFVGLPELLRRYEHRERLDAWLRGVVVRMALARLRRDRRREHIIAPAAHTLRAADATTDPWGALDLERALGTLSEGERAVFVLRQLEGCSHDEIATLLHITSGASRVRYLRALRRLRRLLEPET